MKTEELDFLKKAAVRVALELGLVKDKSYTTVRWGRVASFSGEGLVRVETFWYWVKGERPWGDAEVVVQPGFVRVRQYHTHKLLCERDAARTEAKKLQRQLFQAKEETEAWKRFEREYVRLSLIGGRNAAELMYMAKLMAGM